MSLKLELWASNCPATNFFMALEVPSFADQPHNRVVVLVGCGRILQIQVFLSPQLEQNPGSYSNFLT